MVINGKIIKVIIVGSMNYHNSVKAGVFSQSIVDDVIVEEMIAKNIWNKECPVAMNRLVLLNLSYIDYEGKHHHNGKMVVFDVVAAQVLNIFEALYAGGFPIHQIKLMNEFLGDDNKAMEANNTSSFNGRKIANTTRWSIHSYGMAIDINPIQNPFLDTEYKPDKKAIEVFPPEGINYINRKNIRLGMVESVIEGSKDLSVVDLFKKNGFSVWGGDWNFPLDLHHFQIPTEDAKKLATISLDEGKAYFNNLLKRK
jgi:hypothetical protein